MNLNTGKRFHSKVWTPLPMPDEVIKREEQLLMKKDKQPKLMINTDKKR